MRIAAVMVGTDKGRLGRFRRADANTERLTLAGQIAAFTQDTGRAEVVLLPAGFLAVKAEEDIKVIARELAVVFQKQVLLAGIDEEDGKELGEKGQQGETGGKIRNSKEEEEDEEEDESDEAYEDKEAAADDNESEVADGDEGYRYWAFASQHGKIVGGPWRQRSAFPASGYPIRARESCRSSIGTSAS